MSVLGFVLLGAIALLTTVLVGLVVRRLLGVPFGWLRTLGAGLFALWLGPTLISATAEQVTGRPLARISTGTAVWLTVGGMLVAILAGMGLLVLLELLVPTGSLPGPVELVRGSRSRWARTRRYAAILRIAGRHGLARFLRGGRYLAVQGAPERRALARSLREALEDGGPTFVKLGQVLSTRRDLLSPEFVAELSLLRERARPVPWEQIAEVVDAELGEDLAAQLAFVEREPLAAASVAQVHGAVLRDGRHVVLKVQRPGIAPLLERDLDVLARLARTLTARTTWARRIGLVDLAAGFAVAVREELDFIIERDNTTLVAGSLGQSGPADIVLPQPVERLCTRRLLVATRLRGTPLGEAAAALDALGTACRDRLATALLDAVLGQAVQAGVFHADPHPGNLVLLRDGPPDDARLGLLDLGSVGRLDSTTRACLGRLLLAIDQDDSLAATDALLELLEHSDDVDERALERAVGALIVRFRAGGPASATAAFGALFTLVTAYGLGVPPDVAAVFRALATLEGSLDLVRPGYDILAGTRQVGQRRFAAQLRPEQVKSTLQNELRYLVPLLRRLPRRVDRLADAVEHGRVRLQVSLLADTADRALVTALLHRVLLTVLGGTAGVMGAMLLTSTAGPMLTPTTPLFGVVGGVLLLFSLVLVLRVLVLIFRGDDP